MGWDAVWSVVVVAVTVALAFRLGYRAGRCEQARRIEAMRRRVAALERKSAECTGALDGVRSRWAAKGQADGIGGQIEEDT